MNANFKQKIIGYGVFFVILLLCLPVLLKKPHHPIAPQQPPALPQSSGYVRFKIQPAKPADGVKVQSQLKTTASATSGAATARANAASTDIQKSASFKQPKQEVSSVALNKSVPTAAQPQPRSTKGLTSSQRVATLTSLQSKKPVAHPRARVKEHHSHSLKKHPISRVSQVSAWSLQLGVFSNVANANRLLTLVRKKGYNSYQVSKKNKKGQLLTAIYIGPNLKKHRLMFIKKKLDQEFKLNTLVVRYK